MKTFFLRALFISTVLLFGILLGIYHSHHGSLAPKQEVKQVEKSENVETVKQEKKIVESKKETTTKQTTSLEDEREIELITKQEKAHAVSAFNFYSELGTKVGDIFQHIFSSLVSVIIDTIHSLLNER